MANKGQLRQKKIPMRQCLGCSEHKPKLELLRVVLSPDGEISLDFTGKKSGRGAYLCKKEACFRKARKTGVIHRQLNCEITDELYEELEKEIRLAESEAEN